MPKSEIGEVIKVIREAPPRYQVRLPYGELVVVEQSQIEPQRMTLLTRGSRLRVIHELGRVISARPPGVRCRAPPSPGRNQPGEDIGAG